jgi:hypothetical protein
MGTWLDDDERCERCGWPVDDNAVVDRAEDGSTVRLHPMCVSRSGSRRTRPLTRDEMDGRAASPN